MASRRKERDRSTLAASPRAGISALTTPRSRSSASSSSSSSSSRSPAFNLRGMRDSIREISHRKGEAGSIAKLPLDLLCKSFLKLDSVIQIANCALVCKSWRDACFLDVMWKSMYLRWHGDRMNISQQQSPFPPSGSGSWRESFIRDFSKGRLLILERITKQAFASGFIQCPFQCRVKDLVPGCNLQSLAQELQISFSLRINNGQQLRLTSKQAVPFRSSYVLHCPFKFLKRGMKLSWLACLEVIVSSDTLSQSCQAASFTTKLWESDYSAPPLRLVQFGKDAAATNLIVGTLLEDDSATIRHEEILFIKVGIHLSEIIPRLLKLRIGDQVRGHLDITHGYCASVQLQTFDHLIWTQNFYGIVWNRLESTADQPIVLSLVSSLQVVPKRLSLPWRSEAFSGALDNSVMATISLWDARNISVWHVVRVLHLKLVSVPSVEYVQPGFEGPQFEADIEDKLRGLSVRIKCSLSLDNRDEVFGITDLRVESL